MSNNKGVFSKDSIIYGTDAKAKKLLLNRASNKKTTKT
jgi:hypothetical protein